MLILSGAALAADRVVSVEINKGEMVKLDRPASSVVIADPTTADVQVVSPKLLFIHGKKVGETSLYAIDPEDNTVLDATVEVTHNLSKLARTVKKVAPNADVDFRTIDGGLVMEGFASTPEESANISNVASAFLQGSTDKMVNMVTTAGSDQVTLQVKIVEMSRNDAKRLGINLQNVLSHGNLGLQLLQGNDIAFFGAEADVNYLRTFDGVLRRGADGINANTNTNVMLRYKDFAGVLDALETQGLVHVLAEPTLTTTSGKPASFLAGGEFPIPVNSGDGTISVEYKPFGVSLNFTPVVLSKERMSIVVAPEVSTIDLSNTVSSGGGINNPVINTRKAQATVEMGSGQTFALAGLLKSDNSNSVEKFPGLGDVPVLGTLFRSQQFINNQTELVILVTPYIVRAVADHKLQTPSDGYVPPSDFQRLLLGNLYQQEPLSDEDRASVEGEAPTLRGDGGFILE